MPGVQTRCAMKTMNQLKTSNAAFSRSTWQNFMKLWLMIAKYVALSPGEHPRILKSCLTFDITTKPCTYLKIVLPWKPWRSQNYLETNFLALISATGVFLIKNRSKLCGFHQSSSTGSRAVMDFRVSKLHLCSTHLWCKTATGAKRITRQRYLL